MVYIDFDGVMVNTTEVIKQLFIDYGITTSYSIETHLLLKSYDYAKILRNASSIEHSIDDLKELRSLLGNMVAILTQVNSMKEAIIKKEFIDSVCYGVPLIPVPIRIIDGAYRRFRKIDFAYPKGSVLVDDSKHNIDEWNVADGTGILFAQQIEPEYETVPRILDVLKYIKKR